MFVLGDKAKVKLGLVVGEFYGDVIFAPSMEQYMGQEVVITDVDEEGDYAVDVDGEVHIWSNEMLEKIN
jgi:hypothetical protein